MTLSTPRRLTMRTAVAVAAVALVASVSGSPVQAQDIDSLQNRADALADKLHDLEVDAARATEEYLQTAENIDELQTTMVTTQKSVSEAQARVGQAEEQTANFLITSYMEAGSTQAVAAGGSGDVNDSLNQKVLLDTLHGDRAQIADELAASKADLDDRTRELQTQQDALEEVRDAQIGAKDRIDLLVAEQRSLYDAASAELQEAVQAERARREAEAARQAAADMAAAQAAAAAQSAAAPRTPAVRQAAAAAGPAAPAPSGSGGSGAPAPAPAPPTSPLPAGAAGAIAAAKSQLGVPYRYGGSSPSTGFDCSGLILWSYAQVGIGLPRTSRSQKAGTQPISAGAAQAGDLVFFGSPVYHAGIYLGGGMMIHSPHTGDVVKITSLGYMGGNVSFGRIR